MAKFDYNDEVRITEGRHKGRTGAIVSLPTAPSKSYVVEFGDGSDTHVFEVQLELIARAENDNE
jgi:ribosomal protein S4E